MCHPACDIFQGVIGLGNGDRWKRTAMLACGVAALTACQKNAQPAPASPELEHYAAALAPKMASELMATSGGVSMPNKDGMVSFRADGGTVIMSFDVTKAIDPPSGENIAAAQEKMQSVAGPTYCRISDVRDLVARGGAFRVEYGMKDGAVPLATVDHCD